MDTMDETEQPPPYEGPEDYDSCDIVQPMILLITGRLIGPEGTTSTSTTAGIPNAPPALWELDHDVSYLSRADHKAEFFRHETRTGRRRNHKRHLFSLENPHAVLTAATDYAWFLTSVSRRTLGHVGLERRKKKTGSGAGFRVLKMNQNLGNGGGEDGDDGGDDGLLLFEVSRVEGRYEWWDPDGNRVAIEDVSVDGRWKMVVTTALSRQKADGEPFLHFTFFNFRCFK